jgi:hypothetical protein
MSFGFEVLGPASYYVPGSTMDDRHLKRSWHSQRHLAGRMHNRLAPDALRGTDFLSADVWK